MKPIGDFEIDLVDSLDSIVEGLNSLGGLEVGLEEGGGLAGLSHGSGSREKTHWVREALTSIAGYSERVRSSMIAMLAKAGADPGGKGRGRCADREGRFEGRGWGELVGTA